MLVALTVMLTTWFLPFDVSTMHGVHKHAEGSACVRIRTRNRAADVLFWADPPAIIRYHTLRSLLL